MSNTTTAVRTFPATDVEIPSVYDITDAIDLGTIGNTAYNWIASVVDGVREHMVWLASTDEDMTAEMMVENMRDNGVDGEIADGAVPIYTVAMWDLFIALGAYSFDAGDYTYSDEPLDMSALCQRTLYAVAMGVVDHCFAEIVNA